MNIASGAIALIHALFLSTFSPGLATSTQHWYVEANAACATASGTRAAPFCTIMEGVLAASDGDTIHIAPGTYFENVLLDKDLTLIGTQGSEVTILDGMGNGSVVRVETPIAATLEGLTLTNGSGTNRFGETDTFGGGLLAYGSGPLELTNCNVTGNSADWGGGVNFDGSSLTLINSTVSGNSSSTYGGIMSYGNELKLTGSRVSHNTASGGVITTGGIGFVSNATLVNSTVTENSAISSLGDDYESIAVGGIRFPSGSLTMTNSTVAGNSATAHPSSMGDFAFSIGGVAGACRLYGYADVTNSIIAENHAVGGSPSAYQVFVCGPVNHNLIQGGGWPSGYENVANIGNIDADPLFLDPTNGDYRLSPGSPAIDAGANRAVLPGINTDIRGAPRIINGTVDMGAYEYFERWRRATVPVTIAPPRVIR